MAHRRSLPRGQLVLMTVVLSTILVVPAHGAGMPLPGQLGGWPSMPQVYYPPAPGTHVYPADAQQVMVADRTSGTSGTWARYEWRHATAQWVRVGRSAHAAFGIGGMKVAALRVHGDHSSPVGVFPILYTFGEKNPGATRTTYRTISRCSWWIEDQKAADYNRWRESCSVSGRTAAESESLWSYITNSKRQYRQAAVIGFNYVNRIRSGYGSGAGIFLHYTPYGDATWGCVGLDDAAELTSTIVWLDAAKQPVIVIKS